MYSLVLLTAMSTAPSGPEFNGYFRDLFNRGSCAGCTGCNGCNGAMKMSCTGCTGCTGCNGCCGGSGLFTGDRIRSLFGSNCNGCCGGCCGGVVYSSGCCGGSMASFGTPIVSIPMPGYETYPSLPGFNVPPPSAIPYAPPEVAPPSIERQTVAPRPVATVTGASGGARATVIVRLPADAILLADGTALKMTGTERKFQTPDLPAGMEYTYRFAAEYERNGETLSVSKKVVVRAGATVVVEFTDLTSSSKPAPTGSDAPSYKGDAVAVAPVSLPKFAPVAPVAPVAPATRVAEEKPASAKITVKVPAGATLYVDDKKNGSTDAVRTFTTPPLPTGREFAYNFKVETTRNGLPESLSQKVAFRAGEQLTVDLTQLAK